jgi:hypothetical protein
MSKDICFIYKINCRIEVSKMLSGDFHVLSDGSGKMDNVTVESFI